MTMTANAVGFIGTGIMGSRMAKRLLDAGYEVTVWNRTPGKAQALADHGAHVADTPASLAHNSGIVITMLADGPSVSEVLFQLGAAEALSTGAVLLDMSSIPPPLARDHHSRLAERGIGHVDAPVSGGPSGAEQGALAIMAGGREADFRRVEALLKHLGRATLVGPPGAGQLAKLCNQIIVAITIGAVSEALLLAHEGGADPLKVKEALIGGFADSKILQIHGRRMIDRRFVPGGPSRLQLKDLKTILAEAGSCGLQLPLSSLLAQLYQSLVDRGGGEYDHSALLLEIEKLNAPKRLGAAPDVFTS